MEEDTRNFPCSPVLKHEHADKLAAYTFPIDTIPQKGKSEEGKIEEGSTRPSIIFFNNLDVAHGATQFQKLTEDGIRSYHRDFSRLSALAEKLDMLFPFLPFHNSKNHG